MPIGSEVRAAEGRNRLHVVEVVHGFSDVTRADIARRTGLSRATVSAVVAGLLADDVVAERQIAAAPGTTMNGGRPPTTLELRPAGGVLAAVHLRREAPRVALADLSGTVLATAALPVDPSLTPGAVLEQAASVMEELGRRTGLPSADLMAVGVALSRPSSVRASTLAASPVMEGWSELDISRALRELTGTPVVVDNDANLGALAEWRFGAAVAVDDLVYVMLSEGIGAGLILRGVPYAGVNAIAGEIGHIGVDDNGVVCRCGNRGCLETVAGSTALLDALSNGRRSCPDVDTLVARVVAGEPSAYRVVADAGAAVGRALAGVVGTLDPAMVVIGGTVARAGEPLLSAIRTALARHTPSLPSRILAVEPGLLGDDAELVGAVVAAREHALPSLAARRRR